MKNILKKVGLIIALTFVYMIMFGLFTKFTGIITLLFGAFGTYYLYFKNEKFKKKGKFIKSIYGIGIAFLLMFFGIGGVTYSPSLDSNINTTTNIQDNDKNDEEDKIAEESDSIAENSSNKEDKKEEFKEEVVSNIEAEIHFIDTGNSDAILIKQGDKSVLVDAGDNNDEELIVNYLNKLNINKLNYVISTHPDADHCGGLDAVFENFKVDKLLVGNGSSESKTYSDFIKAAADKGVSPSVPLEGSEHKLTDNSYIKIYNVKGIDGDSNESSLVTLFVNGNDKILLMGDAGEKTEAKLINYFSDVDLLKVGHHGSKTSTTQAFLDKVNPKSAVILVGDNNKYGHPSIETMSKLETKKINIHRTDECGNIVYKSTGSGVTTECSIKGSYEAGNKKEEVSQSTNNSNTTNSQAKPNNNTTNKNNAESNKQQSTVVVPVAPSTNNSSSSTSNNESSSNSQGSSNTQSSSNSQSTQNNSSTSSNQNSSTSSNSQSSSNGSVTTYEPAPAERTVYWVPSSSAKSYHYNRNCRTLSRSKTILEGPGSECPKTDPCNVCVK